MVKTCPEDCFVYLFAQKDFSFVSKRQSNENMKSLGGGEHALTQQLLQQLHSLLPLLPLLHEADPSGGHGSIHPGRRVTQEEGQLGGRAVAPTGRGLLLVQAGIDGSTGWLQGFVCPICIQVLHAPSKQISITLLVMGFLVYSS